MTPNDATNFQHCYSQNRDPIVSANAHLIHGTSHITSSPFEQISARPIETAYPMANNAVQVGQTMSHQVGSTFYNPASYASNNQTGPVFGCSVGKYMNNPMTMGTNLNPNVRYNFPDQQYHDNLQNNMWYNNRTVQLFNQNTGFHRPNPVRRGQKEPDTFNGKTTDWVDYIVQFEKIAHWNDWDHYERAQQLIMSLRGIAQRTVGELNPYQLNEYAFIKKMLSQRFNPLERETAHKFEFKNRRK